MSSSAQPGWSGSSSVGYPGKGGKACALPLGSPSGSAGLQGCIIALLCLLVTPQGSVFCTMGLWAQVLSLDQLFPAVVSALLSAGGMFQRDLMERASHEAQIGASTFNTHMYHCCTKGKLSLAVKGGAHELYTQPFVSGSLALLSSTVDLSQPFGSPTQSTMLSNHCLISNEFH